MPKNYQSYSKDELVRELNKLKKQKKYGLVWEDKPEDVVEQCKTKLPVLNYTHEKKIDVIYIDPPYNTGAKDWKYNNDYVDSEDPYRHSKWLSLMEKRLKIAKKLLNKNGVLICTIDENEFARLGLILEEIYPAYQITCVTIIHNPAGVQGKNFSYVHEYAYFVYPKNGNYIGKTTRQEDLVSPLRDWGTISKREQAKNCFYPIFIKDNKITGFGDVCADKYHPKKSNIILDDGSISIYPIDKHDIERKWVFSRNSVEKIIDQLFIKKISGEHVVMRRKQEASYKTVWDDKRYYANIYGSKLLNNLINIKFPFPKSLYAGDIIKSCGWIKMSVS